MVGSCVIGTPIGTRPLLDDFRIRYSTLTCASSNTERPLPQLLLGVSSFPPPLRLKSKSAKQAQAAAELLEETGALQEQGWSSRSIPDMWNFLVEKHGDTLAVADPHHSPAIKLNYRELASLIKQFAAGLSQMGLMQGDIVALFSENSARWIIADQGVMAVGAADAVRGSTSPAEEMAYILAHSGSCCMIVQDSATLERSLPAISAKRSTNGNGTSAADPVQRQLKFVVVLWGEASDKCTSSLNCPVLSFSELLSKSHKSSFRPPMLRPQDLATLIYTSGTTGTPKAVELTHANLAYQKENLGYYLRVNPGDRTLSLLPPWHVYERSCGYYILSCGGSQVYTSIRNFKEDLQKYPPAHFVCVPLVLDTLYNRVQQQIKRGSSLKKGLALFFLKVSAAFIRARRVVDGVALQYARKPRPLVALLWAHLVSALLSPFHRLGKVLVYKKIRDALGIRSTIVSGGGSLASHLDDFFEVLDLAVLNGWGLSETAPVLACRRALPLQNVRGSVGLPIPGTQVKAVDPVSGQEVAPGQLGLLLAKGPGVMRGYYRDSAATQKAMRAGGAWFDTGDLGWIAPEGVKGSRMGGHIVLSGRAKDTIVLSNGENIEPQPIEDACCASAYIAHMLVVGQDKRVLGALVAPDSEAFAELERIKGPISQEEKKAVIRAEISKVVSNRPLRENIGNFVILPTALSPDDGTLTKTLKPRRQAIFQKYSKELQQLNKSLR